MPRLYSQSSRPYPGRSVRHGRVVHGSVKGQSGHWWNKPGRIGKAVGLCERRAKIVTTLNKLDRYSWSGHSTVMGNAKQDWMDTVYVLAQFGAGKKAARNAYHGFVAEGMAMGKIPEFAGGGLIRSKGGWSQVVSARRRGQKEESDERILGSGDFVKAILKETEEKTRRQLKLRRTDKTITKVIEEECKRGRTSPNELKGGSRRRKVSALRARIAKRGVDELGLSMAEIARHVGVTTSSVARAVARLGKEGRL